MQEKEFYLPGNTHTLVFKVDNNQQTNLAFTPSLSIPKDWILTAPPEDYFLKPGENAILLFPIHIPISTLSARYPFTLSLQTNAITLNEFSSQMSVTQVRKLMISRYQSQDFVKAGDTIKTSFFIQNQGNRAETILLDAGKSHITRGNHIELKPGEHQIIYLQTTTAIDLGKSTSTAVKLTAHYDDKTLAPVMATARSTVIPVAAQQEDVFHRFPLKVAAMYIGRNHNGNFTDGFQGEVYGKGTIDSARTKQIEFRAIGPDQFSLAAFGQNEEYFANYKSKNLQAHLGDKVYTASYLTEFAHYGRGIEINYQLDRFSVGSYYTKPRFYTNFSEQFHGFISFDFNKAHSLTGGYLQNTSKEQPQVNLFYLKGDTQLFRFINFHGEYATSHSMLQSGHAYRIEASSALDKLQINAAYLEASPNFQGFFSNTNQISANVRYHIFPKLALITNYRKDAKNINQDTLYLASPYREHLRSGINYNYVKWGTINLSAGKTIKKDRQELRRFDYQEKFFRLNLMQRINDLRISLQSQFAKTTNLLFNSKGNSQLHTLNVSFQQWKNNFTVYGSYLNTNRYSETNEEQFVYGGRFFGAISKKTTYSLFYQNTYFIEEYFKDRNLFEMQLNHNILHNQTINLVGRYALSQGQFEDKNLSFSIRYTLYLDVPLFKTKEYGVLKGTISNDGVGSVEGVKLNLNNHVAVTDKFGNFTFVDLHPGIYYLEIDKKSITITTIPTVLMPARVAIESEEQFFDFGLANAAKLKGNVNLYNEDLTLTVQKEKQEVIVEISNDKEVYRKICKVQEAFEFTFLRPGEWHIKVYRNGLNNKYQIKNNVFNVALLPGKEQTITIDIIKQKMQIQYLQEPVQIQSTKEKPKK